MMWKKKECVAAVAAAVFIRLLSTAIGDRETKGMEGKSKLY